MRKIRLTVIALSVLGLATIPALAFHDGGVAHCNGCHTMHNSQNGVAMNGEKTGASTAPGQGFAKLLLYPNRTDVCLDCHAGDGGYHVWSTDMNAPTVAERGGGDFVFLDEDNLNDGHGGATNPILGHAAGHSVISDMMNTVVDPELDTAPGGTFPSEHMSCSACHDPHGNQGYRLTYQTGQTYSINGLTIGYAAEIDAVGISVFAGNESNGFHNAYNGGFSAWCATCHGDFHQKDVLTEMIHPSGSSMGDIATAYNLYNGTTDCLANPPGTVLGQETCGSGVIGTSYLHFVPFEDPAVTNVSTTGPTGTSQVSCVSCHRAHATSAPDAGRWDFSVTGLAEDGAESLSYTIPNPYDSGQRSLCNKCHAQDEYDAPHDFTP